MKEIIIQASNIASICLVNIDGVEQRYIYLKKGDIVLAEAHAVQDSHSYVKRMVCEYRPTDGNLREDDIPFDKLPTDVANKIEAHFDKLFAVPIEKRGEAVANSPVVTITKEASND